MSNSFRAHRTVCIRHGVAHTLIMPRRAAHDFAPDDPLAGLVTRMDQLGLTQTLLAQRSGVPRHLINRAIKRVRAFRPDEVLLMAPVLQTPVEDVARWCGVSLAPGMIRPHGLIDRDAVHRAVTALQEACRALDLDPGPTLMADATLELVDLQARYRDQQGQALDMTALQIFAERELGLPSKKR